MFLNIVILPTVNPWSHHDCLLILQFFSNLKKMVRLFLCWSIIYVLISSRIQNGSFFKSNFETQNIQNSPACLLSHNRSCEQNLSKPSLAPCSVTHPQQKSFFSPTKPCGTHPLTHPDTSMTASMPTMFLVFFFHFVFSTEIHYCYDFI